MATRAHHAGTKFVERDRRADQLAAARGIVIGLAIGASLWIGILLLILP